MGLALQDILLKPSVSEKLSSLTDKHNCYAFWVNIKANKSQIKAAVEKFYNVKVLEVRSSIIPGKVKRTMKSVKKSSSRKRAVVKLQDGQKIEFFKAV